MKHPAYDPPFARALSGSGRPRSRLELAFAVIIVGILAGVFLWRVDDVLVRIEKTNVTRITGQLRAAVGIEVASRIVQGGPAAVGALAGSNPMALLTPRPSNYLGAVDSAAASRVAPGHWFFNENSHRLIYVVEHQPAFDRSRLSFAIQIEYRDVNGNGRFDAHRDELNGVAFARVPSMP